MRRVNSLEKTGAGRDWGQEEKGTTEDEMAGWHHRLDEHEFEWTLGVGDGQGGLACCNSWDRKESDTTERLNWTDGNQKRKKKKTYTKHTKGNEKKFQSFHNKIPTKNKIIRVTQEPRNLRVIKYTEKQTAQWQKILLIDNYFKHRLKSPSKERLAELILKEKQHDLIIPCHQETHLRSKGTNRLKVTENDNPCKR